MRARCKPNRDLSARSTITEQATAVMVAYTSIYVYHTVLTSSHRNEYFRISCRKYGSFAFESMPPKHKCVTEFFNEGTREMYEWEVLKG
jgi:hypothetical protein